MSRAFVRVFISILEENGKAPKRKGKILAKDFGIKYKRYRDLTAPGTRARRGNVPRDPSDEEIKKISEVLGGGSKSSALEYAKRLRAALNEDRNLRKGRDSAPFIGKHKSLPRPKGLPTKRWATLVESGAVTSRRHLQGAIIELLEESIERAKTTATHVRITAESVSGFFDDAPNRRYFRARLKQFLTLEKARLTYIIRFDVSTKDLDTLLDEYPVASDPAEPPSLERTKALATLILALADRMNHRSRVEILGYYAPRRFEGEKFGKETAKQPDGETADMTPPRPPPRSVGDMVIVEGIGGIDAFGSGAHIGTSKLNDLDSAYLFDAKRDTDAERFKLLKARFQRLQAFAEQKNRRASDYQPVTFSNFERGDSGVLAEIEFLKRLLALERAASETGMWLYQRGLPNKTRSSELLENESWKRYQRSLFGIDLNNEQSARCWKDYMRLHRERIRTFVKAVDRCKGLYVDIVPSTVFEALESAEKASKLQYFGWTFQKAQTRSKIRRLENWMELLEVHKKYRLVVVDPYNFDRPWETTSFTLAYQRMQASEEKRKNKVFCNDYAIAEIQYLYAEEYPERAMAHQKTNVVIENEQIVMGLRAHALNRATGRKAPDTKIVSSSSLELDESSPNQKVIEYLNDVIKKLSK